MSWPEAFFGAACVAAIAWAIVRSIQTIGAIDLTRQTYTLPKSRVFEEWRRPADGVKESD